MRIIIIVCIICYQYRRTSLPLLLIIVLIAIHYRYHILSLSTTIITLYFVSIYYHSSFYRIITAVSITMYH